MAFFSEYCSVKYSPEVAEPIQKNYETMDFQTIKVQLGECVAWVNLDRIEVRNALNDEMINELTEVFDWLNSRDDVRVIVVKGNGKAFCAGADLNYMKAMAGFSHAENVADAERLSKLFRTIYFCNKAVIASVHGACIGGANGIIAAADIVIAEKETKFAFTEVRLGLTPATISPFVVNRIGHTAAKELMLTGRRFTAAEAKVFHLVNVVVDESEMIDAERTHIEHFMQASPEAVAECKNLLRMVDGTDDPNNPLFYQTSLLIASQRVSPAGQEGMSAFFEKRKPRWV